MVKSRLATPPLDPRICSRETISVNPPSRTDDGGIW
jgi:hypothetical protein